MHWEPDTTRLADNGVMRTRRLDFDFPVGRGLLLYEYNLFSHGRRAASFFDGRATSAVRAHWTTAVMRRKPEAGLCLMQRQIRRHSAACQAAGRSDVRRQRERLVAGRAVETSREPSACVVSSVPCGSPRRPGCRTLHSRISRVQGADVRHWRLWLATGWSGRWEAGNALAALSHLTAAPRHWSVPRIPRREHPATGIRSARERCQCCASMTFLRHPAHSVPPPVVARTRPLRQASTDTLGGGVREAGLGARCRSAAVRVSSNHSP